MNWIDWLFLAMFLVSMAFCVVLTRSLNKSVVGFLAAERAAGRYLICIADTTAGLGAITIIASFEMIYKAGFSIMWWSLLLAPLSIIISLSGWIIYRYRQTRALTMAQFFEMRYSRRFRILMGIVAWAAGIINFGVFPAVGARFIMHFAGLPEQIVIGSVTIGMYPLILFIQIGMAVLYVFIGGQIAIIVTDFFQGTYFNLFCIVAMVFLFIKLDWGQIFASLSNVPPNESLINPFKAGQVKDFNMWFYLITAFLTTYGYMAWQGAQGFNASARSPHEARMARIVANYRYFVTGVVTIVMPVCAYTFMHHPAFTAESASATQLLANISDVTIRNQMTVPLILRAVMPHLIMGMFCAAMVAAMTSTNTAYLHSWGSIFIQDVVMPLCKKPFHPKEHIRYLRLSILFIAAFIFAFSWLYRQTEYIYMFFAITGSIYISGAGIAIIGGLYWRKGSTAAAWTGMITGMTFAMGQLLISHFMSAKGLQYPLNGMWQSFLSSSAAIVVYIAISLIANINYDMDRLFNRGRYRTDNNCIDTLAKESRGWRALIGITDEFTVNDKLLYWGTIVWMFVNAFVFVVGTVCNILFDISDTAWQMWWKYYMIFQLSLGVITAVWITIGGMVDLKKMVGILKERPVDVKDDGWVSNKRDSVDKESSLIEQNNV